MSIASPRPHTGHGIYHVFKTLFLEGRKKGFKSFKINDPNGLESIVYSTQVAAAKL